MAALAAFGCGPDTADLGPCKEGFAELVELTTKDDVHKIPRVDHVRRLEVVDSDLETLEGLECIVWVETLRIEDNAELRDLHGLEGLVEVNFERCDEPWASDNCQGYPSVFDDTPLPPGVGDATIAANQLLETMVGLEALELVVGTLEIRDNPSLVSLAGLQSLHRVALADKTDQEFAPSALRIERNPELASLEDLTSYTGGRRLEVRKNSHLVRLLPPPSEFRDHLSRFGLPGAIGTRAVFEDLPKLEALDGFAGWGMWGLEVRRLPLLEVLPTMTVGDEPKPGEFEERYMKQVVIESNERLQSLAGLPNAARIQGSLIIRDNDALMDLTGLETLQIVERDLSDYNLAVLIENNGELRNLDALSPSAEGAFESHYSNLSAIRNNPKLPTCEVDAFLDAVYGSDVDEAASWTVEGNGGAACP